MELKPGYKMTEVGVIPEELEVKSVRDLGQIKTGPFGTLLKAAEYSGGEGVPLISVGEVGSGTFKVTEHTPLVPDAVVRRLPQYVLRSGDIVLGRKGAVDRSALVTESEDGWFLGSDGISIRPLRTCYPPYLAWQFRRYEVQTWLLQNAIGTTMASLNQEILNRVQIPYAPLPEQRDIAAALSDVDALLAKLDQLIAKKRDIKQAAMQQLLTGKKRLPGFSGEWEVKKLGEVFHTTAGGDFDPSQSSSIRDQTYCYPIYSNAISEKGLYGYCSYSDHEANSITVTARGTLGVANHRDHKFTAIGRVLVLVPKMLVDGRFYSEFINNRIEVVIESTGVPQLTAPQIAKFDLPFPTRTEQTAIAAVLSDMDAEIAALEARRDKTRDLKQGMMQELLTGRIRLVGGKA